MQDILLIADSGSTKTDWLLLNSQEGTQSLIKTQGINPFMLTEEQIEQLLQSDLLCNPHFVQPTAVRFYGAGCRGEQCDTLKRIISRLMPKAAGNIVVGSDLVGAAHALCGETDGIACILGTGSNSGLYIDGKIVCNVSPLGYILGDEGSGAVLGRRLVGDVLKKQLPSNLCKVFEENFRMTSDEIVARVYKQPFANRFLASFVPFLHTHKAETPIRTLLIEEFSRFFERNVSQYERPDLPVSFVGSVAYFFREELEEAAVRCGFKVGKILQSPLDGMKKPWS